MGKFYWLTKFLLRFTKNWTDEASSQYRYHLEHNFGHGQLDLANVLASLNILAFLIHTIQEMIEPAYLRLQRALGSRKTFFNDLRVLTRYMIFDSRDDLFIFMEDGLDISHSPP